MEHLRVLGEDGRITALGKRLPSAVRDPDGTILMSVTCAGGHRTGGATISTPA
jgi:hypothetical protein